MGRQRVPDHLGGFLLLGGRLGDLFGHRRLFLLGIALFTLASAACGFATSQEMLVGARAVQGIGGAVVSAVALSLMMTLFTEPAERAKAMGVFGFVASGGGSIGVLLGGILTDALDWHWIFLVNVPVGILVVVLSLALIPAARVASAAHRLDVAGAVTVTASLMLAVYAIVNGNEVGWVTARTLSLLASAGGLLVTFLVIESRVPHLSCRWPLPAAQHRSIESSASSGPARCSRGSSSPRSTCSSSSATAPLVGLAFLPANLIMGALSIGLSARLVMRASASSCRSRPASALPRAGFSLRASARGRDVRRRRAPGHDPAGPRRRNGVQPGAPRGDERRRAQRGRTRVGVRQHFVHDG